MPINLRVAQDMGLPEKIIGQMVPTAFGGLQQRRLPDPEVRSRSVATRPPVRAHSLADRRWRLRARRREWSRAAAVP
jgi:hypothetical protein